MRVLVAIKLSFNQSIFAATRSLRRCCSDVLNSLIVLCRAISGGSLLYTQINPSALRLLISKKCSLRISISCLLCRPFPDLVQWRSAVDSVKNFLKCSGPLPSAALCNTPNIAISRLHDNGARLKYTSASSREIPSSLKNLD